MFMYFPGVPSKAENKFTFAYLESGFFVCFLGMHINGAT